MYLKSLKPNDIKIIKIDINTLKINKVNELKLKNKDSMLKPPINAPNNILINLAFLFKIRETLSSSKKSKKKLSKIIKSTYIFIYIT